MIVEGLRITKSDLWNPTDMKSKIIAVSNGEGTREASLKFKVLDITLNDSSEFSKFTSPRLGRNTVFIIKEVKENALY